jgi:hypothetical protein
MEYTIRPPPCSIRCSDQIKAGSAGEGTRKRRGKGGALDESRLEKYDLPEDARHSVFGFIDKEPPQEMPKGASIDTLLAWKRVNVNVTFWTMGEPGNVLLKHDARRCMQHLLVTGPSCSYHFGVDDECNEAGIDPRWLRSIYVEEADKQGMLGQISCT